MLRRLVVLPIAALAGAMLLTIEPAIAQDGEPYPPAEPMLTVFPATVIVGDSVTVEGSGFGPGENVQITVSTNAQAAPQPQESGSAELIAMVPVAAVSAQASQAVTADGGGGFTTPVTLTQVGTATITATSESGLSASAVVNVVPSAEGLPETGNATSRLLTVGGGVVALGSALLLGLLLWRRRDRTEV
jgi:LPXTG-motif cell wall-anchored protein